MNRLEHTPSIIDDAAEVHDEYTRLLREAMELRRRMVYTVSSVETVDRPVCLFRDAIDRASGDILRLRKLHYAWLRAAKHNYGGDGGFFVRYAAMYTILTLQGRFEP